MANARNNFVSNTYMKHFIGLTVFVNLTPEILFFGSMFCIGICHKCRE